MDETAFHSGIRMHADGAGRPAVPSSGLRIRAFTTTTTKAGKTTR